MKQNKFVLNTLLAVELFLVLLAMLLVRVFNPSAVLPKLDIPNMVLLSLVVLLVEYFVAPAQPRCYICIPALSAVTFALLPWVAGFACLHTFWKFGLVGAAVFTATTWLFSSITDRMASGKKTKLTAVVSALGLYLAAQCFAGILL